MILKCDLWGKSMWDNYAQKKILPNLKKIAKSKYKFYCLAFDVKDEDFILDILLNYTTNFILLKTNNIDSIIESINIVNCNTTNCKDKLEEIFADVFSGNIENRKIDDDKRKYIIFIRFSELTQELKDLYKKHKVVIYPYMFEKIMSLIKKDYKYYDLKKFNGYAFLQFTDNNNEEIIFSNDIFTIKFFLGGLGDLFATFSLEYEFIQMQLESRKKIYNIFYGEFQYNCEAQRVLKNEVSSISFNNGHMFKYWRSLNTDKFINIFNDDNNSGIHITDLCKKSFNFTEEINPYKHNNVLIERILNNVSENEIEIVNKLLSDKNFIGLQCFTGVYCNDTNKWLGSVARNWNEENVKNFLELCFENKVDIIVLTPNPYDSVKGYLHLPELSVGGYVYAISKLKLVVGIDSSAGHIAAFYNIPSITIWGESTPLMMHVEDAKIGFRVLRNNMSIVSQSRDIKKVNYKIVYDTLVYVLNNGIIASDKIISYEDSVNGFNTIYVD